MTIEDILEEIVGEIRDETDLDEALIAEQSDGSYIISGKLTLDDFQRYFHVEIPEFEETNFTTLAGFASSRYKEIKAGTIIEIASFRFTVLEYQHAHIDYFKVESTERKNRIKRKKGCDIFCHSLLLSKNLFSVNEEDIFNKSFHF